VQTDGELLRRSVEEPHVFEEIFERHGAAVSRYVGSRIGANAAEEITSESFLIAFARRSNFDPSYESARPWLFGIATNLIRHRLREERVHLAARRSLAEPPAGDELEVADRLDAERMRPLLVDALLALSSKDRETFLLIAVGELTYPEAANALGVPVGTIRSRMHRVRSILRERIPGLPATNDEGA
jgi:RNA polymerase sigma factor (sigma-70 family)